MKRLSLRIRYTFITSLFLLISCACLTFASNVSANHMIQAFEIYPSSEVGTPDAQTNAASDLSAEAGSALEPAAITTRASYRLFRKESTIATILIVLAGSAATYFAAGYVLKPIVTLSEEVKKRNATNFAQTLPVPSSSDEIQELTISFNELLTQVQRSLQMQKQFSADAAHELRTPLAVLQTKLDVFALSEDLSEGTREFVQTLQDQLGRLTALIEDLLWFSRDLPFETVEPVPLRPLLQDVAEELSDLAQEKGIEIRIYGEDRVVSGQDRLLEQVFYNLLENAIKYGPQESAVTVTVAVKQEHTVVEVADQGEGIPQDCREEVFEPFFRVEKSRSRAVGGSGLGLAVCKKILDRHGATICVLPNYPRGSVFQIVFPS